MFWDVNFNSESIDSLLNKEDVTLKELLDDEDILQDYKYQNKNLTQLWVMSVDAISRHQPPIILNQNR